MAAYVAAVAAKSGKDTGALATAGGVTGTTPAAGKQVFTGVGVLRQLPHARRCGDITVGPNLDQDLRTNCATPQSKQARGATLEECIRTAIVKPYAYLPSGYKAGVMPSNFGSTLTPSEITALVNFLSTAAK